MTETILTGYGQSAFNRDESREYPGAIPVEDVQTRLFNWTADEYPVTVITPDGVRDLPQYKAVGHSGTGQVFGIHGANRATHQYTELVDNARAMLGDTLHINSAGTLGGGAQAWISLSMAETFKAAGDIEYRPNLILASSHDASLSNVTKPTVILPVCWNTFHAALGEAGAKYSFRSTRLARFDANAALEAIGLVEATGQLFSTQVEKYLGTQVSDRQFGQFIELWVPKPEKEGRGATIAQNKRDRLMELWTGDERVSPWRGTQFGALQAVNTYTHWDSRVQGATRTERNMDNVLTGKTEQTDQQAMKALASVLG